MEESIAMQLHQLREEQHRLEQLLGHTALGASFEGLNALLSNAQASAQQRCVRAISSDETRIAAGANTNTGVSDPSTVVTNNNTAAAAVQDSGRAQWSYQDRLKELEALKKKYEAYARTSMSQYLNSVGDYKGYKERREARIKHTQPFTFEGRELMKPQRIREQRAEEDRRTQEAALQEQRRHPPKAKPVPPSTFMNKYELMVEEWCQRKAAIELMSRERARLAKEEADYVRVSAQSLRKTREELMGVTYGPDGKPITKSEQRRRAQSADAQCGGRLYLVNDVPLEVKMKLWPAISDHERVRKERIKYRAAVRKIEVDEEVRQVLPLLSSPTPGRCYDAAAGVNAVLRAASVAGGVPCYGMGQAIHPANLTASTLSGAQGTAPATATTTTTVPVSVPAATGTAVAASLNVVPPVPQHQPSTAATAGLPLPAPVPTSVPSSQLLPGGGSATQLPTMNPTSTVGPTPLPQPLHGAVGNPASPVMHQSLTTLSVPTVTPLPPGVGAGGASSTVSLPPPPPAAVPIPPPPVTAGVPLPPSVIITPPPPASAVPTQLPGSATTASAASTASPTSIATTMPPTSAPSPPLSVVPATPQTCAPAATTIVGFANPAATSVNAFSAAAAGAAATTINAILAPSSTAATAAAAAAGHNTQEEKEAAWRRYNPQLTFKPNVKPGVPNFEALWAKNQTELSEKKKTHPTTTPKPFHLTPSARAEKTVGRRPTRSVVAVGSPPRHRPASRTKKPASAATATPSTTTAPTTATTAAGTTAQHSPSPPSHGEATGPEKKHSNAPRGTRAHALRTEAIYSNYVKQSEVQNKIADEDGEYWKAVAQRQREVRKRLAVYITNHHLEHELTIKSKVRALRASMKENEKAAEERLAEMKRRVAEMPPVFAEPVHLHEESKARAEVEKNILQSLKDTGLDGATIKSILQNSSTEKGNAEAGDAAAVSADNANASPAATPEAAIAEEGAKAAGNGKADAPHSPTSTGDKNSKKKTQETSSSSSDSSNSDSESGDSSSSSSSSSDSSSASSSHKKSSSAPPRSTSLSVPSVVSIPVPKPVTPKDADYSEDSFEDSSDSD